MTEPDEALLWARESAYLRCLEYYDGDEAEARAQMESKDAYDVAGWLAEAHRAGAAASAERIKELGRTLINTAANLRGAISLLENGGKKAAPSNKMFEIMLSDYRAAADRAYHAADRAAALLKESDQ